MSLSSSPLTAVVDNAAQLFTPAVTLPAPRDRDSVARAVAHRPRDLITLVLEACDRDSRLSALPTLGPLQMLERYVCAPRLFVIGGATGDGEASSLVYSLELRGGAEWRNSELGYSLHGAAAAVRTGELCFAGGVRNGRICADAYSVDEHDATAWLQLPPMRGHRSVLGLVSVRGSLFALGGDGDEVELATAECLAQGATTWSQLPPMTYTRAAFASCALGESFHVAGDCFGDSGSVLHERYDTRACQWTTCAPLPADNPSRELAGGAVANCFAVCGGHHNGNSISACTMLYDTRADSWRHVASLGRARYAHSCVVLDDQLFAVGGWTQIVRRTDSVEVYDAVADRWHSAWFALPRPISQAAIGIVE